MASKTPTRPNVARVAWSILRALVTVRAPRPTGVGVVDHGLLREVLSHLDGDVVGSLPRVDDDLASYLADMEKVDPDGLTRDEALAYWLNVYNAAGLRLAALAVRNNATTVLGIPGAFSQPVLSVAGEALSLDDIEHGKLRRLKDPRVHAALVCGSVSCPTLARSPFGGDVQGQLDKQMRRFLSQGALRVDSVNSRIVLSPIFSWFGRDFTRPKRMPTFLPAPRNQVLESLLPWIDEDTKRWITQTEPEIRFGRYDWRLACAMG